MGKRNFMLNKAGKLILALGISLASFGPINLYAEGEDDINNNETSGEVTNTPDTVENQLIQTYNLQGVNDPNTTDAGNSNEQPSNNNQTDGNEANQETEPPAPSPDTTPSTNPAETPAVPSASPSATPEGTPAPSSSPEPSATPEGTPLPEESTDPEETSTPTPTATPEGEMEKDEPEKKVIASSATVNGTVLLDGAAAEDKSFSFALSDESGKEIDTEIASAGSSVVFNLPSINEAGDYTYTATLNLPESEDNTIYYCDSLSQTISVHAELEEIEEAEQESLEIENEEGKKTEVVFTGRIVVSVTSESPVWNIYSYVEEESDADESEYRIVLESGNVPEGTTLKWETMSAEQVKLVRNILMEEGDITSQVAKTFLAGTVKAVDGSQNEFSIDTPVTVRYRAALSSQLQIYNTNGVSKAVLTTSSAGNPYPGSWNNCTWAAWKLIKDLTGISMPAWGNAGEWYSRAAQDGYTVSGSPTIYSVAVWGNGGLGHVGVVTDISEDGKYVYIREGNFNGAYHEGWWPAYGIRTNQKLLGYINIGTETVGSGNTSDEEAESRLAQLPADTDPEKVVKLYRVDTGNGLQEVEYSTDGDDIIFDTTIPGTYVLVEVDDIDLDYEILDYNAHFRFEDNADFSVFKMMSKKEFHQGVDAINQSLWDSLNQGVVGTVTARKLESAYEDGEEHGFVIEDFSADLNGISHLEVFRVTGSDGNYNVENCGHAIVLDENRLYFTTKAAGLYFLCAVDYVQDYTGRISSTGINRQYRIKAMGNSRAILASIRSLNSVNSKSAAANKILATVNWVGGSDSLRTNVTSNIHVIPRGIVTINASATGDAATTYGTASSGIAGVASLKTATINSVYNTTTGQFHTVGANVVAPTTVTYKAVTKSGTTLYLYSDYAKTTLVATITNYDSTTQTGTITYASGQGSAASGFNDTTTNVSSVNSTITSNASRINTLKTQLEMD